MGARSTSVFRAGLWDETRTIALTGDRTLSVDETKNRNLIFTGTLGGTTTITAPLSSDDDGLFWFIHNNTNQSIVFKAASAGSGATIAAGVRALLLFDGAEIRNNVAGTGGATRLQDLTEFTIPLSPGALTTAALLTLGAGTFGGGSANGQYVGIAHDAASFSGNWLVFRDATAVRFAISGAGLITLGNSAGQNTLINTAAAGRLQTEALSIQSVDPALATLLVNGPTGQSTNLTLWQVNAATLSRVTKDGYLGIGADPSTTKLQYNANGTGTPSTTLTHGLHVELGTDPPATAFGARLSLFYAMTAALDRQASGVVGSLFYRGTTGTTQTNVNAIVGNVALDGTSPTGTLSDPACFVARSPDNSAGGTPAVTFTRRHGYLAENQGTQTGAGTGLTISTSYGIRVKAQSGASTKSWGIVSEGGECQIISGAVGNKALSLLAVASQTAALFEAQDSGGTARVTIGSLSATADPTLTLRRITSQTGASISLQNPAGTQVGRITAQAQGSDGASLISTAHLELTAAAGFNTYLKNSQFASLHTTLATMSLFPIASQTAASFIAYRVDGTTPMVSIGSGVQTGDTTLDVMAIPSQTGALQTWRSSAGVIYVQIGNNGDQAFGNGVNISFGTGAGTKLGTSTTQKMAAFNATPVVQPASANQAALTDSTGGTADGTVADVGAAFSQATLNNNFADIIRLVNQLRSDLVSLGWIKGSA